MDIVHTSSNNVDVLAIVGRLDAAGAPQLRQELDGLFEGGRSQVVLDLAKLEYIASPGLRVLIEARKRAREHKRGAATGDVRIANLPSRIQEVFNLTGFTSLFEIYQDTDEAVGSF